MYAQSAAKYVCRPLRPDHDAVLVVAERGRRGTRRRPRPRRRGRARGGARSPARSRRAPRATPLGEVHVEAHAEPLERRADPLEDAARAPSSRSRTNRSSGGRSASAGALARQDVRGELADVLAVVAVLGHLRLAAERLQVPRLHRRAEPVHLAAGVVEVVLALDASHPVRQQPRERVADAAFRACPSVQRPRRVRAHELDLDAPAVGGDAPVRRRPARRPSAGRRAASRRARDRLMNPGPAISARSTNGAAGQGVQDRRRATSRGGAAGPLRERERDVRREVAVLLLLGRMSSGSGRSPSSPRSGAAAAQPAAEPRSGASSSIIRRRPRASCGRLHQRERIERLRHVIHVGRSAGRRRRPARAPTGRRPGPRRATDRRAAARQTSYPSMPGIMTSRITQSGCSSARDPSASSPRDAVSTRSPPAEVHLQQADDHGVVVDEQDASARAEHSPRAMGLAEGSLLDSLRSPP